MSELKLRPPKAKRRHELVCSGDEELLKLAVW
jgi:hypothetical protein